MISLAECGDCIEKMKPFPDRFFDLAIVDPPYGFGTSSFVLNNRKKIHSFKKWNNTIPGIDYFQELYRVSKNQIIWGENYFAKYIPHVGRIVFHKQQPNEGKGPMKRSGADLASQSYDRVVHFFSYSWAGNIMGGKINWKNVDDPACDFEKRIHPTQKPVVLYEYCLRKFANSGDKILDTHLGSGSSRIAAYKLGFDFWGFEIDPEYFEAQEQRFNNFMHGFKGIKKDGLGLV